MGELAEPDPDLERLRAELAAARARTRATFQALAVEAREEVAEWGDWRRAFRARPELFLGVAFLAGFLRGSRR